MNIVYVDENDVVVGSGSISNAIDNGIIHRIARVFITNSEGQLLIQKRSDKHLSLPGRWDQSAAGHVDEGESYEQAAERELWEEMGIKNVLLKEIDHYYADEKDESKTRKRFNKVFWGTYNGQPVIDGHEVSDYEWVEPKEIAKYMKLKPENYTQGFIEAFVRFIKLASR